MGELVYAAKITHVPSMYLSEIDGPHKGCREHAINGHKEISKRCREAGVDTIVVFDTHWLVNSGYHINNAAHFEGVYTSNELPHFIKNMPYEYQGNPELGFAIAEGLKVPRLLESYPDFPVIYPNGANAYDFYFQEHLEKWFNHLYYL